MFGTGIKRTVALLLAVISIIGGQNAYCKEEYAQIVARGETVNVEKFGNTSGYLRYIKKDGVYTYEMTDTVEATKRLYIDAENSFLYSKHGQSADVSVEYFDEGTASFCIVYKAFDKNTYTYVTKQTESISLENTGSWKSATFSITDAAFNDMLGDGYDICVKLIESDDEAVNDYAAVKSVKLVKGEITQPVYFNVSTQEFGNIFTSPEKVFTVDMASNTGDSIVTNLKYSVKDDSSQIIYTGMKDNIALSGDSNTAVDISFILDRYGPFTLIIEAVTKIGESEYCYFEEIPFSYINESAQGEQNSKFAVSAHLWWYSNPDKVSEVIRKAGFSGVRDGVEWHRVERSAGNYVVPQQYDVTVPMVNENGLDYLTAICFGHPLYDNTTPFNEKIVPYTDEGIAAYAAYCKYIAGKYKGKIKYYEIWNEYNIKSFNYEERDYNTYFKMLKAAYTAIKEADPEAKVVAMATAGVDNYFIEKVIKQGAESYCDIISVHPYQWDGKFNATTMIYNLKRTKMLTDKPIWYTELGWNTGNETSSVTEEEQAIFGIQSYVISDANDLCERYYWYDIQNDGAAASNREHHFGLIDAAEEKGVQVPGAAKPAYVAFAALNKLLADSDCTEFIREGKVNAYKFDKKDSNTAVLWGEGEVVLKLGCESIDIMDMYSNVIESKSNSKGVYKINLGKRPVYVNGKFNAFEITEETYTEMVIKPSDGTNVATEGEKKGIGATIINYTEDDILSMLRTTVYDEKGNEVEKKEESVTIPKNTKLVKQVVLPAVGAGNYSVKCVLDSEYPEITAEFSYTVQPAETASVCEIENLSGIVTVSGKTKEANGKIGIYMTDGKTEYINQFESDENGGYMIQLEHEFTSDFSVKVNDGQLHEENFKGSTVKIIKNSTEIEKLSELTNGDEITVEFYPKDENAQDAVCYVAGYSEDGKLICVYIAEHNNDRFLKNITVTEKDALGKISCYVWKNDMTPIYKRDYE